MKYILIGAVLLVGIGYGAAKFYLHSKVSDGVETGIQILAPYAAIEYGGISSTITGELTIDDIRVQVNGFRDEFDIGSLGIDTSSFLELLELSDFTGGIQSTEKQPPKRFGLIVENIRFPVTADFYKALYESNIKALAPDDIRQRGVQCVGKYGHSPKALKGLGYQEFNLSTWINFRQEPEEFYLEFNADVADMFSLKSIVEFQGDLLSSVVTGFGYRPKMSSLNMELLDQSLNARIKKYCTELGLTAAQITAAHINALQYFGSTNGILFDDYVVEPYKRFLDGKPTLIVTAKPREPLDLADISKYKPSDVPALLNLEAAAQ